MALYESVIIGRQDLTPSQFETIVNEFISVIESLKGTIQKQESWGLRNLAYKINKNRKGHYMLLNIDGPADAIVEYERLMRLHEDIIRFLTMRIKSVDEKPSPLMSNKNDRQKKESADDISEPKDFSFRTSNFSDFISTCKGETAMGKGSRFPLVISTSINPYALEI